MKDLKAIAPNVLPKKNRHILARIDAELGELHQMGWYADGVVEVDSDGFIKWKDVICWYDLESEE